MAPHQIPRQASGVEEGPPRRSWVEHIMGMPISVHLRGPEVRSQPVEAFVQALFDDLRWSDRVFSTWKSDSAVSRLRRGEITLADCPAEVREISQLCIDAGERTDGWFESWLPDADGVRRFDPTGVVKGWAVDRAARVLGDLDDHDFYINAGGDIVAECRRYDTEPWQIAVESPVVPGDLVAVVPVVAGGVATSGTAERGLHIIDPFTGRPSNELASITICGPSLTWCDVYATAAFARGTDAIPWLTRLEGHAAVVVDREGTASVVIGGSPSNEALPPVTERGDRHAR